MSFICVCCFMEECVCSSVSDNTKCVRIVNQKFVNLLQDHTYCKPYSADLRCLIKNANLKPENVDELIICLGELKNGVSR